MRKKFRITMDTNKEAAMIVHLPNRSKKFKEWPNDLYAMRVNLVVKDAVVVVTDKRIVQTRYLRESEEDPR